MRLSSNAWQTTLITVVLIVYSLSNNARTESSSLTHWIIVMFCYHAGRIEMSIGRNDYERNINIFFLAA